MRARCEGSGARGGRGRTRGLSGASVGGWLAVVLVATLVGPLAAPATLSAQRADLIPQLGFFTGLSSLGTAEDGAGASFALGERERGFAYGVAAQFGSDTPAGLRGSVLFGTGSDIPVSGPGCAPDPCSVEQNVRAFAAALVVRPLPSLILIRPYLLAGAGWKRFGFDDAELEAVGLDDAIEDQTKGAWQLGAGVELGLGLTSVVVEINDFISGFSVQEDRGDGKTQHDLFLTVGLRL